VAAWRVRLEPGVEIDSLCEVLAGADWQEREQYDMVGVRFRGHPDLRRILMPPEYEGFPLRRDHAADAAWAPWR
jgi:NADH-quinone oxidoreductase subunit C